jgi:methyl-accepting chemotaxis protein
MLLTVSKNLASHCIQNEVTVINASNHYDYIDSLKGQDIEVAIIFKDMSCVTSIKNENDYRIREIECNEDLFENPDQYTEGYFQENVLIDDKSYYACFTPIVANGEVTGVAYSSMPQNKVSEATHSLLVQTAVIAGVMLVLSIIVVLIFSQRVSRTFVRLGGRIDDLAKGDLRKQKEQKSSLREMHVLLNQTQVMQENLVNIINKVKSASNQLVESIGEVNGLSENTYGRAKQIVESVEELTKSAEYMNTNVQEIAEQMEEIGECVNEMSDSVGELHRHSENILQTNDGAKANLERIMDESRKSVEAVRDITAQIHETNNSIERVDEAVAMILSISAETNLLSLNASIEAARAGEQGKGFSVIAEEIFELSQQTAKGAEMIKQLAKTITNDSQKSVDLATQVQSMIVNEQDGLKDTFREYEKLSGDIGLSADEIRAIAQKTKELSEYKEKVIENVGNLGAVSEENTTSNEEVSGNISEIIAQVQNINADCSDMNDMAHQLEETMDFFS